MQQILPARIALVNWQQKAGQSSIYLHKDALIRRQTTTYPSLELTPDVKQEAQGKLLDAYFVGFQNVADSIRKSLKRTREKLIGKASRALQYYTCKWLAEYLVKESPELAIARKGQVLVMNAFNQIQLKEVGPHIHSKRNRIFSLGYSPNDENVVTCGKLSLWNLRDSGYSFSELLNGKSYIKEELIPQLTAFTPFQNSNEHTFLVFIDGALAHSVKGILVSSKDAKRWIHLVEAWPYTPGTRKPQPFRDILSNLKGSIIVQKNDFIHGRNFDGTETNL